MANPVDLTEVTEWQGNAHVVAHLPSGDLDCGYFQKGAGGDLDGDEAAWGSGGMGTDVQRPARPTRNAVTISRAYSPIRDAAIFDAIEPYHNRVRATYTSLVLDGDGNVVESKPYEGIIKAMGRGSYDDTSSNQREFTMEIRVNV